MTTTHFCNSNETFYESLINNDDSTEENPAAVYVLGGQVQDDTLREGAITDPHYSMTGAMASVWRKFTIIKLLGAVHQPNNFDGNAFPKAFFNEVTLE